MSSSPNEPVMYCPRCHGPKNRLMRLTEHPKLNVLKRRRWCLECDYRWTTIEMPEKGIKLESALC